MFRSPGTGALMLLVGCLSAAGSAHAINCSGLPTQFDGDEFPSGNFLSNFDNSCYLIPLLSSNGQSGQGGDLNSIYSLIYFKVDPRYQLILLDTFPNARHFSVTVYDAHSAIAQSLLDTNIVPLTKTMVNPFKPGQRYLNGQRYAAPINFGGNPGIQQTGCRFTGFNLGPNAMDATQRHAGINWNTNPAVFQKLPNIPEHVVDTPGHTNPNTAGVLMVRSYLDITPLNAQTTPAIIVRDVASGCAYPAAYAEQTLQIVTSLISTGTTWLDTTQAGAHRLYDDAFLVPYCYGTNPQNMLSWSRGVEYVPGLNPYASEISAIVPSFLPTTLANAGEVMRFRFRVPVTPPTPCTNGCSRSGTEQLRYMSLSFQQPGAFTLASLADNAFTKDPNGYVTLIVGTGAGIPSWITPANGYTFLDLTAIPGYQQLYSIFLRNVLPGSGFMCSGNVVPYNTTVYTPFGGLMGDYLPIVDYPLASSLPTTATPLVGPNNCARFPNGRPAELPNCSVVPSPPTTITSIPAQAPGASQIAVQPAPPVTIVGGGLGLLPQGLPYTGDLPVLQIVNDTEHWTAGFTSDFCSVSISDWLSTSIDLVLNLQNGACPLVVGDQLTIKVWNPQSGAGPATSTVTVSAN